MIRGCFVTAIIFGVIAFFVGIFIIKLLWAWTVPDIFPGAVEQGLIAAEIGWWTAVKLSIILALFAGFAGGKCKNEKQA